MCDHMYKQTKVLCRVPKGYTWACKPGHLMSHIWLHTPNCKVLDEVTMKLKKGKVVCRGSRG